MKVGFKGWIEGLVSIRIQSHIVLILHSMHFKLIAEMYIYEKLLRVLNIRTISDSLSPIKTVHPSPQRKYLLHCTIF